MFTLRGLAPPKSNTQREIARATLAREVGYVRKPHGGRLRVALAFPEHLFRRDVEPRLPDDLPAVQRPSPTSSASASSCRRSRSWPTLRDAGAPLVTLESQTPVARLRRHRVLGVVRVGLHQRPDDAAAGRRARCAPPSATHTHPLVVIGGAVTFVNPEPLALVRRRDRRRRRRGAGARRCSRRSAASRSRSELLRRLAAGARLSTSRRSTTSQLRRRRHASPAIVPRDGTGAPPVVRKAALKTTEAVDPPATTHLHARHRVRLALPRRGRARLRQPVPLLLGRLQLPAGARVSDRAHPRAGAAGAQRTRRSAGLVSIALCDHPDIEHILRSLADMGYCDQPGVAAPRRPDADDRRRCCARAASARSRSRRRPAPIACAASSTRRSPTTRSSTAPS